MSTSRTSKSRRAKRRWQFGLSTLLLSVTAAAVVAWFVSPERKAANYVERDLALEVKVLRGGKLRGMDDNSIEVALVNRSTRRSHLILRHQLHNVFCDAQYRLPNGKWTDVPGARYDEDDPPDFDMSVAARDIVQLSPGSRISKKLPTPWFWMFRPPGTVPSPVPTRYRVRFHCVYEPDRLEVELPLTTTASGGYAYEPDGREPLMAALQQVPSFHLTSRWVEFTMK